MKKALPYIPETLTTQKLINYLLGFNGVRLISGFALRFDFPNGKIETIIKHHILEETDPLLCQILGKIKTGAVVRVQLKFSVRETEF